MFSGLDKLLKGKKTYLTAIIVGVIAGYQAYTGVAIPEFVYAILGAFGLASIREAVGK